MFDCGIPIYAIPLNVTHQAIFHIDAHRFLLDPSREPHTLRAQPLPAAQTPLRQTLSTLFSFFAQTYKEVFKFEEGPPVHDALVVAYVAKPHAFKDTMCRVDAELSGKHTRGAIIVDTYNRVPRAMRNVEMATGVQVGHNRLQTCSSVASQLRLLTLRPVLAIILGRCRPSRLLLGSLSSR